LEDKDVRNCTNEPMTDVIRHETDAQCTMHNALLQYKGDFLMEPARVVNEEPTKPTVRITEIDHESFQAESGHIYFTILLETIHDLFL
jgi:hypothetical protein